MPLEVIKRKLDALADPHQASNLQRFFKTGPGEYAEGDVFRGIKVPDIRKIAVNSREATMEDAVDLLLSKFHEDRLLGLFILIERYKKADEITRQAVYNIYLENTASINNWDLVDLSAPHIVGAYLHDKPTTPLDKLAESDSLWERRIAILATFYFIKHYRFDDALRIAAKLLNDPEDLIHKAVGWMLREVGKRELNVELEFLYDYYQNMPRTMLRYAIEKFPEELRQSFLKGSATRPG
jgi:3-methyladenine DNA glycosylase AlkD